MLQDTNLPKLNITVPTTSKTRPWNQPNLPVYSLSTLDPDTNTPNMNICTYVSAITMDPKKFMIGVYKGTKTYENLQKYDQAILQVLSTANINLVRKFGQTSGNDSPKLTKLQDQLSIHEKLSYLQDCVSYMYLKTDKIIKVGDHDIWVMDVLKHKSITHPRDILYTYHLKNKKIIR